MKKVIAITIVLTLVLAAVSRGADSPKGGSVNKGESFKIDVPTFDTKVKQGETQSVTIKLERGESFKQDVTLEIELSKGEGITFDPAKVIVNDSDKPDVQLMITVPKDAALGEYKVSVTGTPTTGEPTSVEFNVKVIAPEAGHTMQSDSPKGGNVGKGEEFKIAVPTFDTKVKQGEIQSVTISLDRGESFKQDVTLEIKLSKGEGITFDPAKVLVKASDKPDMQLMITVPKDTAPGEYKVSVTGTPTTGEPTSVEFNVKVIALEAGYTMQSDSPNMAGCMKRCQANMEDVSAAKAAIKAAIEAIDKGDTKTAKIEMEKADKLLSNVHKCMKENMQQMPCTNAKCPMMGKSIDRMNCPKELTRMYKGTKVGFCSAGCPTAWDKLTDIEKDAKLKDAMPSRE